SEQQYRILDGRRMTIWGIADIHGSSTDPRTGRPTKPMDVFGPTWENHISRLEQAWKTSVLSDDTVLIAGDIDWALHLQDALETLERIHSWPGRKILARGNHDYWWSSKSTSKVRSALPPSLSLIHNDALQAEGFNICGAKGSPVPGGMDWTEENAKLLNREVQRLSMSLQARDVKLPTIVMLHYPPFYPGTGSSPYRTLLEDAHVSACIYGHLHGSASSSGPSETCGSVKYRSVAGDALDFQPLPLARLGKLLDDPASG
ncbi:MAG TPA: metallophosphoesterase, partial [Chloroflexota bacterium]